VDFVHFVDFVDFLGKTFRHCECTLDGAICLNSTLKDDSSLLGAIS